jgi:hypothetical protein
MVLKKAGLAGARKFGFANPTSATFHHERERVRERERQRERSCVMARKDDTV